MLRRRNEFEVQNPQDSPTWGLTLSYVNRMEEAGWLMMHCRALNIELIQKHIQLNPEMDDEDRQRALSFTLPRLKKL